MLAGRLQGMAPAVLSGAEAGAILARMTAGLSDDEKSLVRLA
jgi:hypothetical protein